MGVGTRRGLWRRGDASGFCGAARDDSASSSCRKQPLADLLVAFRRDQVQTRYETLDDLLTYCEKSANPVGRIVLLLGRAADAENVRLSDSICTGLQLANFWQDVQPRLRPRAGFIFRRRSAAVHGWDEAILPRGNAMRRSAICCGRWWTRPKPAASAGQPLVESVGRDLRCRCGFSSAAGGPSSPRSGEAVTMSGRAARWSGG